VKAQIWDTAGQEKYQAISSNFFKRAQGVLLVFDITNYQTFQSVKTWLEKITTYTREDCVILLVGNKSDLENTRKVPCDKAFKFAKENGIFKYREVSIYNENDVNDCIDKVFVELVREIYKINSNDVLYPNAQGKANSLTNSQRVTFATKNFNYVNHGTVNEATSFYCC
jgi:Ras-related protein Rab-11A